MARQAHAGRFVSCAKYVANIRSLPLRGFRAAQKQGRPTKVGSAQSLWILITQAILNLLKYHYVQ